jgi:hypothetical protein
MIDSQSLRPVAALCRWQSSPEGCWKLAGGETPGKPSRYPCALKGRRKALTSFAASPSLCLRASASWALASVPVCVRPGQSISIFSTPSTASIGSFPTCLEDANLYSKSTPGCCKSTVDLELKKLICGKNGLQTPLLPDHRRSFSPITPRELERANQKQTEPNQKMNPPSPPLTQPPTPSLRFIKLH